MAASSRRKKVLGNYVCSRERQAGAGTKGQGEKLMEDEDEKSGVMWVGKEKQEMR